MYEFSEFKVVHHLDKIQAMLAGGNPAPVTVEIDPTNVCNHRCAWCIDGGFNRTNPVSIPFPVLERFLGEIAAAGVRSVVVKGGGEPLCYPDVDRLLQAARGSGLEVGLITNGELLAAHAEAVAANCSWVRVSMNGATSETYERLHRPAATGAFERTLAGIRALAPRVFTGVVFVTAADNVSEVLDAAKLARDLGARYISIKPICSRQTPTHQDASWLETAADLYAQAYRQLHGATFQVFGSAGPKGDVINLKPTAYDLCEGPRLVGILCADAKMYPCCALRFNADYCFGSVAETSFQAVWNGERRQQVLEKIRSRACRKACVGTTSYLRYDHYNRLFQYLSAQAGHVAFL